MKYGVKIYNYSLTGEWCGIELGGTVYDDLNEAFRKIITASNFQKSNWFEDTDRNFATYDMNVAYRLRQIYSDSMGSRIEYVVQEKQ